MKRGRYDKDTEREVKTLDSLGGTTSVGFYAASVPTLLIAPPVNGANYYQRIGQGIKTFSLEVRGDITISSGNANATLQQYARIIVFYDKQPNGALPGIADFLLTTDNTGSTYSNVFSGLSPLNRKRFMILRDTKYMLPAVGAMGVQQTANGQVVATAGSFQYHEYIPVGGLMSYFKGNAGTIADFTTGSYCILCIAEDTNMTSAWKFTYDCRMTFEDANM